MFENFYMAISTLAIVTFIGYFPISLYASLCSIETNKENSRKNKDKEKDPDKVKVASKSENNSNQNE